MVPCGGRTSQPTSERRHAPRLSCTHPELTDLLKSIVLATFQMPLKNKGCSYFVTRRNTSLPEFFRIFSDVLATPPQPGNCEAFTIPCWGGGDYSSLNLPNFWVIVQPCTIKSSSCFVSPAGRHVVASENRRQRCNRTTWRSPLRTMRNELLNERSPSIAC